jgi:hypothetical protein
VFTLAIQNSVNPREMGAATSSSQFFRQIGSTIGVAIFGTLVATTLTTQLPRYMPAEMQHLSAAQTSQFNMGQLQSGDTSAVSASIKAGMQATYSQIELALTKGDPAAAQSLLDNPQVPADLKEMLRGGGISARVKASLDAEYAAVAAAIRSGRPAALAAIVQDPRVPVEIRARLRAIPPAALADPHAAQGILDRIRQGFDAAAPQITQAVAASTLAGIKQGLDREAETLTAQVTSAIKQAFTDAVRKVYFWGLFIVVLGFAFTLLMPNLELHTRSGAQISSAEGGPASNAGGNGRGAGSPARETAETETTG